MFSLHHSSITLRLLSVQPSTQVHTDSRHAPSVWNWQAWQAAFKTTCPRCAEVGIPPTAFRYSPGWVGLWRRHAKVLLEHEDKYRPAFKEFGFDKLVRARLNCTFRF